MDAFDSRVVMEPAYSLVLPPINIGVRYFPTSGTGSWHCLHQKLKFNLSNYSAF